MKHVGYKLLLRLIHKLPVDDAKEGVHHEEEDELPTDELVEGALETTICETRFDADWLSLSLNSLFWLLGCYGADLWGAFRLECSWVMGGAVSCPLK